MAAVLCGCGGGSSNSTGGGTGPQNPAPTASSLSPSSALPGSNALTLTVTGSNFISSSAIDWNGTALTTTYVSATQLTAQVPASDLAGGSAATNVPVTVVNPAPGGGTSSALQFGILARAASLESINLPANRLVWDATHGELYASLPSSDTNGNSVVAINPLTATASTPVQVGSDPDVLAISSDDSFLYVGLDATGQVERFILPALTLDTSLSLQLPDDPIFGQQAALNLAVAPGEPHTFAAILGNYSFSGPNTGGTVLYDDATPRTNIVKYYQASDSYLAWGASPSILYANDSYDTGNDLYVMSASSSGLTLSADYGYLVPTQYGAVHFDPLSGYIFSDNGRVVDGSTGNLIATFNLGGQEAVAYSRCALDTANGLVFFLEETNEQYSAGKGMTLEAFDSKTYASVATLPLPDVTGSPVDLIRWGNAGLAFHVSNSGYNYKPFPGPIYLVDGSFVNSKNAPDFNGGTALVSPPALASISPQSATAGSSGATLTVTGAGFDAGTAVMWNGQALETTLTSATQLQATVSAADLATAGTALVSISDSISSMTAPNSLGFTILPASSGTTNLTALNLASLDLAWDATDSQLIVPVWSADAAYPNTILEIDPTTGSITKSTSVPPDPGVVSVTGDDNLYVGFQAINAVDELTLPDLGSKLSWSLGAQLGFGPYIARDIEPAPGESQTVAVSFGLGG